MSTRWTKADLEAKLARRTRAEQPQPDGTVRYAATKGPTLIRQASKGPNKWEREYALVAYAAHPNGTIYEQDITLRLANGVRYTPDVVAVEPTQNGSQWTAYEIKGQRHAAGIAKIKIAASKYPFIRFVLVWKLSGVWQRQEVRP